MRRSNLLCCGHADGQIVLRDPRSLRLEQTINAHMNGLSGLEADGTYLYSFGYAIRWECHHLKFIRADGSHLDTESLS